MTLNTYIENRQDIYPMRASYGAIVKKAIFNTLVYEGIDFDCEVSVSFVDNEEIKEMNKKYRNIDKETDVLSFPMYDDFDNIKEPIVCLGDIVISLEKAYEQGHNLYHSVFHEIAFLSIHSTLHLLGYDHERSKEDEDEMIRKQKEIMEIIGF